MRESTEGFVPPVKMEATSFFPEARINAAPQLADVPPLVATIMNRRINALDPAADKKNPINKALSDLKFLVGTGDENFCSETNKNGSRIVDESNPKDTPLKVMRMVAGNPVLYELQFLRRVEGDVMFFGVNAPNDGKPLGDTELRLSRQEVVRAAMAHELDNITAGMSPSEAALLKKYLSEDPNLKAYDTVVDNPPADADLKNHITEAARRAGIPLVDDLRKGYLNRSPRPTSQAVTDYEAALAQYNSTPENQRDPSKEPQKPGDLIRWEGEQQARSTKFNEVMNITDPDISPLIASPEQVASLVQLDMDTKKGSEVQQKLTELRLELEGLRKRKADLMTKPYRTGPDGAPLLDPATKRPVEVTDAEKKLELKQIEQELKAREKLLKGYEAAINPSGAQELISNHIQELYAGAIPAEQAVSVCNLLANGSFESIMQNAEQGLLEKLKTLKEGQEKEDVEVAIKAFNRAKTLEKFTEPGKMIGIGLAACILVALMQGMNGMNMGNA